MILFGIIFIVSTTFILFFVNEKSELDRDVNSSVIYTFKCLWKIMKLNPMIYLITFLLTWKASRSDYSEAIW